MTLKMKSQDGRTLLGGASSPQGSLHGRVIRNSIEAPRAWRIRNTLRKDFLGGLLANWLAHKFTRMTGIATIVTQLSAVVIKADGRVIKHGVVSRRVVTTAGVNFLVDDWDDGSTSIANFNYHASGTGTTAAAITDTALETEATADTDRATGTKSQPSANILQSVGTQTYTGTVAVTEHGLLSSATEGAGTLWDRHVFTALNVVATDQIQWTYQVTFPAGG